MTIFFIFYFYFFLLLIFFITVLNSSNALMVLNVKRVFISCAVNHGFDHLTQASQVYSSHHLHLVHAFFFFLQLSDNSKILYFKETVIVKNIPDDRLVAKGLPHNNATVVILLDNLCKGTTYYFCVSASNLAGKSPNSEVVQCTTLMQSESVIPGRPMNHTC